MDVWHLPFLGEPIDIAPDDLWGHVAHFPKHPKASLVRGDVIVIADKQGPC